MLMALSSLHFGGLPLVLLTLFSGLLWGGVDMWEQSMQTRALRPGKRGFYCLESGKYGVWAGGRNGNRFAVYCSGPIESGLGT